MAKRIQRQRTKGWRMPEGAVYVGRPSKWGNGHVPGHGSVTSGGFDVRVEDASHAVWLFRTDGPEVLFHFGEQPHWEELRGKDLACWCPLDQPCHADVLLEWANANTREEPRHD